MTVRIGISSFAHGHAWSYAWGAKTIPDVTLVGIVDPDKARAKAASERLGVPVFKDMKALKAEGVHGVAVCSANAHHERDVLAAAAAGLDVISEKPVATTEAAAKRMVAACRKADVRFGIAFPVRWCQPVLRAKKAVDDGAIGRVLAANTTNHGSMPGGWFINPKLSGGGAVIDHTVHVADVLRWILKDEVVEVYAEAGRLLYPTLKCDDCGTLSMRFRKGTIATLDTSWSRPKGYPTWGDVTLKLWGDSGLITTDAFAQQLELMGDRHRYVGWGDNADADLIADFIQSIRDRRPPAATGEDGLAALRIALAAYRSARTHRPVALRP